MSNEHGRKQLLGILFLGVLMGALDIAIVGPALTTIQADYAADQRQLAWVFAIYVLFNLIGTPLMAKLSDSFGRRAVYVLDVGLFALGSLLVAAAPSFGLLLVGRAVQGLGSGGIFPVASAVIGDTFPAERRGAALGMIGAVFGLAFLVGPIIGGVLLLFGWRWLFLINLPLAALVIGLSLRLIPAGRPGAHQRFDWPGMLLLGALLSALSYGLSQIDSRRPTASLASPAVWPFLLAAVALTPLFLSAERRAPSPILRLGLLRSRQVALAALLALGAGLSEAAVVFVPALAVTAFGVSSARSSFMLLPMVLAMAVGSPLSGRLLDRMGSRVVVVSGAALIALSLLLEAIFAADLAMFYLFNILFGLGIGVLLGAALRYIMLNEAPAAERASAQGLLTIFTGVGQLLGGVLVGALANSGGLTGYTLAFLVLAALMLLQTLAALGLKGRAAEQATLAGQTAPDAGRRPSGAHS